MKNFVEQQEQFNTFSELVNAATSKYTLSLKGACKALKCSRSWANNYIRPFVPVIYLSNGRFTDLQGNIVKKANFAYILSQKVNEENGENIAPSNESIYFDRQAFNEYVKSRIVRCQKRSKKVPKTYFIKKENLKDYYFNLFSALFLIKLEEKDLNSVFLDHVEDGMKDALRENIVLPTKRTKAEWVDVDLPDVEIKDWKAVHDMMDYGDVEETIYRDLFRNGSIRIELMFPNKDGIIKSKGKVYYLDDPAPVVISDERRKIEEKALTLAYKEFRSLFVEDEKDLARVNRMKAYIEAQNTICVKEQFWRKIEKITL